MTTSNLQNQLVLNTPLIELKLPQKILKLKIEYNGPTQTKYDRLCLTIPNLGKQQLITNSDIALAILTSHPQQQQQVVAITTDSTSDLQLSMIKLMGGHVVKSVENTMDAVLRVATKYVDQNPGSTLLFTSLPSFCYQSIFQEIKSDTNPNDKSLIIYCHVQDESELVATKKAMVDVGLDALLIGVSVSTCNTPPSTKPQEKIQGCEWIQLGQTEAYNQTRHFISKHGLTCGILSGAILFVAQQQHQQSNSIGVCILPDSAYNYSKTLLNEQWLLENKVIEQTTTNLAEKYRGASVDDLQLPEATCIYQTCSIQNALETMISLDFSQLPVISNQRKIVGLITLSTIQNTSNIKPNDQVKQWMYIFPKTKHYTIVTPNTPLQELEPLFEKTSAIFVTDTTGKFPLAVVTKFDVLGYLRKRGSL